MKGLLEKRTWRDRLDCWLFGHGPTIAGVCWECGKDLRKKNETTPTS